MGVAEVGKPRWTNRSRAWSWKGVSRLTPAATEEAEENLPLTLSQSMCLLISFRMLFRFRMVEVGNRRALISGSDQTVDSVLLTRQSQ